MQDGRDEGARGTLALGPSDMYEIQAIKVGWLPPVSAFGVS